MFWKDFGWTMTDRDNLQFGMKRDHGERCFEFKQYKYNITLNDNIYFDDFVFDNWYHDHIWYDQIIDLDDYTEDEIEEHINTYGYTLKEDHKTMFYIRDVYPEEYDWIMAECIFEQELFN